MSAGVAGGTLTGTAGPGGEPPSRGVSGYASPGGSHTTAPDPASPNQTVITRLDASTDGPQIKKAPTGYPSDAIEGVDPGPLL